MTERHWDMSQTCAEGPRAPATCKESHSTRLVPWLGTVEYHELCCAKKWSLHGSVIVCVCSLSQWCPTVWGPPHASVRGVFQARVLEWVALSFSRGSSWPRDGTGISCISCLDRPTGTPGKPMEKILAFYNVYSNSFPQVAFFLVILPMLFLLYGHLILLCSQITKSFISQLQDFVIPFLL